MTATEFIQAVEAGREDYSTLYNYFKKGDFTKEDMAEAYKAQATPVYYAKTNDFAKGKLFAAQTQSFDSWAKGDSLKEDKEAARLYLQCEDATRGNMDWEIWKDKRNKQILEFIQLRIWASRPSTKDYENPVVATKISTLWASQNQRLCWNWR